MELIYKNYRPVSTLKYISKLTERVVALQLNEHLKENDILEHMQSAYKSGHSTETALLKVQNDILMAMDNQKVTALLLLDLSAAFDTVNHTILLNRLQKCVGITGGALRWFQSYLENRKQSVRINNVNSEPVDLKYGVPQGSVLGPVLFSLPYYAQSSRGFNFRAESMRENKTHGFRAARGARKLKRAKCEFENWVREN